MTMNARASSFYMPLCIRAGDDDEEPMDDEDCIVIGITQEDSTVESLWQYTALPQVTWYYGIFSILADRNLFYYFLKDKILTNN
jgi:hypothetical protein